MSLLQADQTNVSTTNFNGALSSLENTVQKALDTLDNISEKKPSSYSSEIEAETNVHLQIRFIDTFKLLRERVLFFAGIDESENNHAPYYTMIKGDGIKSFKDGYIPGNAIASKSTTQLYGFTATLPVGNSQIITQVTGSNNSFYGFKKDLQTCVAGDSWGTQAKESNVITYSSTSTSYATITSNSITLTNSANKVLALAIGSYSQNTSGAINDFALAIDGTTQDELQHDYGVVSAANIGLAWLFSPGNTSAHTYALQAKTSSGTLIMKSPGLVLIEIPSTVSSSISSSLTGAGQKRTAMSVSANSKVLMIFTGQCNITPNSDTSWVGCKFQIDDSDVTQVYKHSAAYPSATASDVPFLQTFVTDKLSAGSHNFDAEITENGSGTLVKGRLILVEIKE